MDDAAMSMICDNAPKQASGLNQRKFWFTGRNKTTILEIAKTWHFIPTQWATVTSSFFNFSDELLQKQTVK